MIKVYALIKRKFQNLSKQEVKNSQITFFETQNFIFR